MKRGPLESDAAERRRTAKIGELRTLSQERPPSLERHTAFVHAAPEAPPMTQSMRRPVLASSYGGNTAAQRRLGWIRRPFFGRVDSSAVFSLR